MKTLAKNALLLVGLVLATAAPAVVTGQVKAPANKQDAASIPKGLRVFVCGHSLHWYIPTPLGELASEAGIKDHQLVGTQSLGASKTLQHWNLPEGKNKAKEALKTGGVDVFTMSPIQFPDPGIENFVKLGLEHNPNMRFTVQISWGGWDIDNQDFPKGATNKVDRNKTPEQLKKLYERNIQAAEAQADEINKKLGKKVLYLVPSAQAVVAIRTRIFNKEMPGLTSQAELFRDPISHPTAPLEALNTYLHFAVIYGQSPVGLPMPSLLKKAKKEVWDDKFNRSLQELAWDTVTSYPYSGIKAQAQPGDGKKGEKSEKFPTPPKGFATPRDGIDRGKLEPVEYDSTTVGVKRKAQVYTPPGYSKDQKYPVLYLLHGIGGDQYEWSKGGAAHVILDNLYADKKAVPMIVVLPNGRASKDLTAKDPIPKQSPAFAAFEKDLLTDLIPFIEKTYSVKADRESRTLAGLSMGGGQSLNFGLAHLDKFAWVGGFSSAPNTKKADDLVKDSGGAAKKLKLLWLSCGDKDKLMNISKNFHDALDQKKVPHVWHVNTGGHDFAVWRTNLYHFVPLLFRSS